MVKCALHIKIESKITMLPIYNFEFTIKYDDVYYPLWLLMKLLN